MAAARRAICAQLWRKPLARLVIRPQAARVATRLSSQRMAGAAAVAGQASDVTLCRLMVAVARKSLASSSISRRIVAVGAGRLYLASIALDFRFAAVEIFAVSCASAQRQPAKSRWPLAMWRHLSRMAGGLARRRYVIVCRREL